MDLRRDVCLRRVAGDAPLARVACAGCARAHVGPRLRHWTELAVVPERGAPGWARSFRGRTAARPPASAGNFARARQRASVAVSQWCLRHGGVSSLVFYSVPNPAQGLAEVRRVLRPDGRLRMMEHVRARNRLGSRLQDLIQPAWTFVAGGCRPNRDTERAVESSGFRIQAEGRRARGTMRSFQAVPLSQESTRQEKDGIATSP